MYLVTLGWSMKGGARSPERVLVKEVNWLGDLVISLPALRALRLAFPRARLSVLIKQELGGFFDGFSWVDEVIPYSVRRGLAGVADRCRIVCEIRRRQFDLAVLFPRSFQAALWVALAGVTRRAGFATDGRALLLTERARFVPELHQHHQRHDYLYMLQRTLGIETAVEHCAPDVHGPHRERMRASLEAGRRRSAGRLVAIAPAAAYGPAKEWPTDRYGALIDLLAERYGAECVLVGAPREREKCELVRMTSRSGALVAAGETGVGELMALLSLCDGFVGNDSGAMHAAAALGIPTVGIFGSTRAARTAPVGPRTAVVQHPVDCSPCLRRTCRFGHYDCLTGISVPQVLVALQNLGAVG